MGHPAQYTVHHFNGHFGNPDMQTVKQHNMWAIYRGG